MFEIIVRQNFSAAHQIEGYPGNCSELHGHNWRIELCIGVGELNELGMALDFKQAKKILREIIGKLDHTFLNDNPFCSGGNPTAERLAELIYIQAAGKIPEKVSINSVTVWESENAGVRYSK